MVGGILHLADGPLDDFGLFGLVFLSAGGEAYASGDDSHTHDFEKLFHCFGYLCVNINLV